MQQSNQLYLFKTEKKSLIFFCFFSVLRFACFLILFQGVCLVWSRVSIVNHFLEVLSLNFNSFKHQQNNTIHKSDMISRLGLCFLKL